MGHVGKQIGAGPIDFRDRAALLKIAGGCADYLCQRIPYLRMIAVSGSLAHEQQDRDHNDIDFFVIAEKGHIWETFLGCLWHGWRLAHDLGLPRQFFCFNYLVSEDHPEEIDLRRPEYVREFLRLKVLKGHHVYEQLLERLGLRLSGTEPQLYDEVKNRIGAYSLAQGDEDKEGDRTNHWYRRTAYRSLSVPFIPLAKWMERRRRQRFPGGYFYSNPRVIRSHSRGPSGDSRLAPDDIPSAEAFSRVAAGYDQKVVSRPANRHMRGVVRETLDGLVVDGMRLLDLGAGTGVDAVWLAKRGASVLAVDAAQSMVDQARQRAKVAGLEDRVQVKRLAMEGLQSLLPEHARSYDLVLANFGVLNLCGHPDAWAPIVRRLLKPDGHFVANVMNRWSLWELAAGFARPRPSFALQRVRGEPIHIGGVPLPVRLYTPSRFIKQLSPWFKAQPSLRGLCVVSPPPVLEHFGRLVPGLAKLLDRIDLRIGRWPLLRGLGDHFLAVLRPHDAPLFNRKIHGSVTAAPVVEDVNGDGAPEVVVPSSHLYVLSQRGANLAGWPKRLGGPLASTPTVVRAGDEATIYVGCDDDRLHGVSSNGTPVPGFPFPAGGDVFSSPLVTDLDGDGLREITFGSDDGRIYCLDAEGRIEPGWPVQTGGFVSASPVCGDVGGEAAIFVGSWDGKLYGLDRGGLPLRGWPQLLGFPIWSTVALADIDGDGYDEILVATHKLFAFRGDGRLVDGFPVALDGYAVSSPAVADINGDGSPEVVVGGDKLYAFDGGGRPVSGFPVDTGAYLWASPILVDVDGDGYPEIVAGDFRGRLWAVKGNGQIAAGYPKKLGPRITAPATAADVDGDGYLELLVATSDGRVLALPTECHDSVSRAPWPTFPRSRRGILAVPSEAGSASGLRPPGPRVSIQGANVEQAYAGLRPEHVHVVPRIPRPFRPTEVHLNLPADVRLEGAILYYDLDDMTHPSPVLGGPGSYFALIQPLPPLKQVRFHLAIRHQDKVVARVPDEGYFRIRIGIPGLRRDQER